MKAERIVEIKFNPEKDSRPVVLALVAHIEEQTELNSRALRELVKERDEARAKVERLQEQVEIVRRLGAEETSKAAYEAMDAERRSWESRRAVENVTLAELHAEIERLTAELSDWQEATSYWEGPRDCLERECEEFFDEDGNDRPEKDHCSHMTAKFLTPEEVAKAISGSLSGGEAG